MSEQSGTPENSFAQGEIAQKALAEEDVQKALEGAIQQANLLAPSHNSITWCESRFVCVTMSCGGSDWC
jgi:hypothetical protein